MLRARREHDGYLAAFTAAVVVAHIPFTGTALDPRNLNPFREVDPDAQRKLDEVKRFIAKVAMTVQVEEGLEEARRREELARGSERE